MCGGAAGKTKAVGGIDVEQCPVSALSPPLPQGQSWAGARHGGGGTAGEERRGALARLPASRGTRAVLGKAVLVVRLHQQPAQLPPSARVISRSLWGCGCW